MRNHTKYSSLVSIALHLLVLFVVLLYNIGIFVTFGFDDVLKNWGPIIAFIILSLVYLFLLKCIKGRYVSPQLLRICMYLVIVRAIEYITFYIVAAFDYCGV